MYKKAFKISGGALILCLVVFLFIVFYPRKYNVPQMPVGKNIRYLNLSTGSRIAFWLVPSRGIKRPFPVIFLQGGPGGAISDRTIDMMAPLSKNGYDVYLYDQVGSGHSARLDNIEEYTVDRHKRDLEEMVKKTGAEKVILIGQSWGAILAAFFVADNPGKVEKLIFTGPGPLYPLRNDLDTIAAPDSLHLRKPFLTNRQANEKVENLRSKTVFLCAKLFGKKLASDKEMDDFNTLLSDATNKSTVCDTLKAVKAKGGGGYYAQIMTMQSLFEVPDARPKLKNSKTSLYIMRGQCDNQPWGLIMDYFELFTHHRLVIIPGAGHSISIEQPGLYLKTIRDFLNE